MKILLSLLATATAAFGAAVPITTLPSAGTVDTNANLLILDQSGLTKKITPGTLVMSSLNSNLLNLSTNNAQYLTNIQILQSNVLIVTPSGNDNTGQRGNITRPFATTLAARSNALDGFIQVYPGTYQVTNLYTLATNGVNWHFSPGTYVNHFGSNSLPPFTDSTNFGVPEATHAITSIVAGLGSFTFSNPLVSDVFGQDGIFWIGHPNSKLVLQADRIFSDSQASSLWQSNGVMFADVNEITNANYSPIWWAGGEMHIKSKVLKYSTLDSAGNVYIRTDITNNGSDNLFVDANLVKGYNNASAFYSDSSIGSGNNFRSWINMRLADSTAPNTIYHSSGFLYYDGQKVSSTETNSVNSQGVIHITSGPLWLRAQKVSSAGSANVFASSGTNTLEIQELEDTANAATFFTITGGSNHARILHAKANGGITNFNGIITTGGQLQLHGGILDTRLSTGTNAWPVRLFGGKLVLGNVELLGNSNAIWSVYSTVVTNLDIRGSLTANLPLHPNVNITNGFYINTFSNEALAPFSIRWQTTNSRNATITNLDSLAYWQGLRANFALNEFGLTAGNSAQIYFGNDFITNSWEFIANNAISSVNISPVGHLYAGDASQTLGTSVYPWGGLYLSGLAGTGNILALSNGAVILTNVTSGLVSNVSVYPTNWYGTNGITLATNGDYVTIAMSSNGVTTNLTVTNSATNIAALTLNAAGTNNGLSINQSGSSTLYTTNSGWFRYRVPIQLNTGTRIAWTAEGSTNAFDWLTMPASDSVYFGSYHGFSLIAGTGSDPNTTDASLDLMTVRKAGKPHLRIGHLVSATPNNPSTTGPTTNLFNLSDLGTLSQNVRSGTTNAIDFSAGNYFMVTNTIASPNIWITNAFSAGTNLAATHIVVVSNAGAFTYTFTNNEVPIRWAGGSQPAATHNGSDVYTFIRFQNVLMGAATTNFVLPFVPTP